MKKAIPFLLLALIAPACAAAVPYSGNVVQLQQAAIAPLIIIAGLIVSLAIFIAKSKAARAIFGAKDAPPGPEGSLRPKPGKKHAKAKPAKKKSR